MGEACISFTVAVQVKLHGRLAAANSPSAVWPWPNGGLSLCVWSVRVVSWIWYHVFWSSSGLRRVCCRLALQTSMPDAYEGAVCGDVVLQHY